MKGGEYLNVKRSSTCQQESHLAPVAFAAEICKIVGDKDVYEGGGVCGGKRRYLCGAQDEARR